MDDKYLHLGPVKVEFGPKAQELWLLGPQIVMTRFADIGIYHPL
jgi:hypothetical protein